MPPAPPAHFPTAKGLKLGVKNKPAEVKELQEFLQAFGYLKLAIAAVGGGAAVVAIGAMPVPFAVADPGTFDESTHKALTSYQHFHGLPPSGVLDDATMAEMSKPRCGVPDLIPRLTGPAGFSVPGYHWTETNLSYTFDNTLGAVADVTAAHIKGAARAALDLWQDVTPLRFRVSSSGSAHLKFRFFSGPHGDGDSFDGPGRVLAHAFLPTGSSMDGEVHFDVDEEWTVDLLAGTDLVTVAAHEIGHALGLDHSQVRGALMYPSYSGPQRFLHDDDIEGIQSLYR